MEEWKEIFKSSIVLIILMIVLGVVVGLVYMSQTTINQNKDKLAQVMNSASVKEFQQYDGTIVSGEVVRTAIAEKENTATAIFVKTAKSNAWGNFAALQSGVNDINGAQNVTVPVTKSGTGVDTILTINDGQFVNLEPGANGESFKQSPLKVAVTSKKGGKWYINSTAQFYACVLYDENGSITGVAFQQVNAK